MVALIASAVAVFGLVMSPTPVTISRTSCVSMMAKEAPKKEGVNAPPRRAPSDVLHVLRHRLHTLNSSPNRSLRDFSSRTG
jgi:hypothetical protein